VLNRVEKSSVSAISCRLWWSARLVVSALVLVVLSSHCHAFNGKIIKVDDGDLVTVLADKTEQKIRLYGIVCPVRGQPFHEKAQALTSYLALQRNAEVTTIFRDSDGIENGLIRVEGAGDYLNQRLISHGLAWVKPSQCRSRFCDDWRKMEELARWNAIGLWAESPTIAPWDWKQAEKMEIYERSMKSSARPK